MAASATPMSHSNHRNWTDLDDHSRFRNRPPNVVILTDDAVNGDWGDMTGDDFQPGYLRRVRYYDQTNDRWFYYELMLYKHPTGAGAFTFGTSSGRMITKAGAYTTDLVDVDDIAGVLFAQYYETTSEGSWNVAKTTLAEGDYMWVIRNGYVEILCDENLADGDRLVAHDAGGTTGAFGKAVGTIASQAEVLEIVPIIGKSVGIAKETITLATTKYGVAVVFLGPAYY